MAKNKYAYNEEVDEAKTARAMARSRCMLSAFMRAVW